MRWLWFVGTLVCLAIAFRTHSLGLAALALLGALVTLLVGTLALASRRIESRSQSSSAMLDPVAMRQMRENIEKRKRQGDGGAATVGTGGTAGAKSRDSDADPDFDSVPADGGSND
jgi:membrane protein implicated in regulation of membrane protease activity